MIGKMIATFPLRSFFSYFFYDLSLSPSLIYLSSLLPMEVAALGEEEVCLVVEDSDTILFSFLLPLSFSCCL